MAMSRVAAAGLAGLAAGRASLSRFENPGLFVALPAAITTHAVLGPQDQGPFQCPKRAELHKLCQGAKWFDRLTVEPVNRYLDKRGTALTQDALGAISRDMAHTNQMSPGGSASKQIADIHQQALHQRHISAAFSKAGEHEGALMHKLLAGSFQLRASVTESAHKHGHHFTNLNSNSHF